jgi:molybdopterin-guanine dinucleotide biosynthesis protein A
MTHEHVLVLPCDLPRIERGFIARLAQEHREADALIIEQDGVRNPLIARYRSAAALSAAERVLARGKRSLQAVLDELAPGVRALVLDEQERASLLDWDTPEDVARDR